MSKNFRTFAVLALAAAGFYSAGCNKNKDDNHKSTGSSPLVGGWIKHNEHSVITSAGGTQVNDTTYPAGQEKYFEFYADHTYADRATFATAATRDTGTYDLISNNSKIVFTLVGQPWADTVDIAISSNTFVLSGTDSQQGGTYSYTMQFNRH